MPNAPGRGAALVKNDGEKHGDQERKQVFRKEHGNVTPRLQRYLVQASCPETYPWPYRETSSKNECLPRRKLGTDDPVV